jgi:hypothetical protein
MVVVALLAILAAGCGSGSSTSTSTTAAKATSNTTSASAASGTTPTQPSPTAIPAGSVAVVDGTPITQTTFNHWEYVAAKSQATAGQPVIVPDPPDFKSCLAQARTKIPTLKKAATKTLLADCKQLYQSLSSQVMDFLIKADWLQADAVRHGVVPTDAQVERAFETAKNKQFPTESSFQKFLAKTGESLQDIRLRFRVNVTLSRLAAKEKGSTTAKDTAVEKREKRLFTGQTRCTALVLMADCGNYRSG